MATYRRKGKGWEVRWYDAAGTRHSKVVPGTLREAKAKAGIWEGAPVQNRDGVVTFAAVAELWLASGGRRHSKLSQEGAERRLRLHVLPVVGEVPVADVTSARIEALHHQL